MWTLGRVKAEIRSNLDDPQGSYTDDAFILPKIQAVYEKYASELSSTDSAYDEGLVELIAIGPGTPNLQPQQLAGQPLELLVNPIRIDWKFTGLTPDNYQKIPGPKDIVPNVVPGANPTAGEWRKYVIWLTPATSVVDLQVRGEFDPIPLTDDSSVLTLHPRIGYAVACQVSANIAKVRGNKEWVAQYGQDAMDAYDDIAQALERNDQSRVRRVGRMTRRNRSTVGPLGTSQ
jgi:hypothetical protein